MSDMNDVWMIDAAARSVTPDPLWRRLWSACVDRCRRWSCAHPPIEFRMTSTHKRKQTLRHWTQVDYWNRYRVRVFGVPLFHVEVRSFDYTGDTASG